MNLDAISAIAETVGFITLHAIPGFWALQICQVNRIAQSASQSQYSTGVLDTATALSGDTEASRTYITVMVYHGSLTLHERFRFGLFIYLSLQVTKSAFFEHKDGLLSLELWEPQWRGEQKILSTDDGRETWVCQKSLVATSDMEWFDDRPPDKHKQRTPKPLREFVVLSL